MHVHHMYVSLKSMKKIFLYALDMNKLVTKRVCLLYLSLVLTDLI